ncbi:MAG: ATP-binding protein [Rhodanobacteraceae bacterium]|nr:ATP-binding protein [Rhodanobacteraceae bacterium]
MRPRPCRFAFKCPPRVVGATEIALGFNDLSGTRTNGKKATRLCPCGYAGDTRARCRCTPEGIARYRSRLSGPLLDRIDIMLNVPRIPHTDLRGAHHGETSAVVRERVASARAQQLQRAGKPNAWLANREVERDCVLRQRDQDLLDRAVERLGLSARAYHRILRVARTIADLAGAACIETPHVTEAVQYRRFDFGETRGLR